MKKAKTVLYLNPGGIYAAKYMSKTARVEDKNEGGRCASAPCSPE
jgi:hypothetical protein